jgi:threonyl-tRNA synthetase
MSQLESKNLEGLEEREITNDLDRLRHSTAHVLAHAVKRLWPQAKFGIGPTIEDGFYYDIDLDFHLTTDDLLKIEGEMKKIIKENNPFIRDEHTKEEATKIFTELNQWMKLEIIRDLGQSSYSSYQEGDFIDLCRGPHVQSTGEIKAFKLLNVSGAFWRGNQKNKQLQRIYGTAFFTQKELDEYLYQIEEAKKRDHRKLGRELDLFIFDQVAPGSPFFLPKGTVIYNRLVQYMRDLYKLYGYQEIITPQILDVELWHTSGHYENYKENMFFTHAENREFAVKPMNCPASTYVFSAFHHSYRDLPLRLADFGRLHRYEKSGALSGLTRVRTFCQDDAHIYCTPEQIESEINKLFEMIKKVYDLFEFKDVEVLLSTRPEKRIGSEELWDQAENALKSCLEKNNLKYKINHGDGAFYGPKIDFNVKDALKRNWQLSTIQLDWNLAERFKCTYTGSDNSPHTPVVIHRAVLGSLERFIGVITEHYAGAFPFWLAPIQVVIASIAKEHAPYCHEFANELKALGFRVIVDDRNESISLKTRENQMKKIPFMLVAGSKEMENKTFSLRRYGEKASSVQTKEAIINLFNELEAKGKPSL